MGTTQKYARSKRSDPPVKRRGFTAFELLIAIGLMTATDSMTIPMFRQYQINADLDIATEHLVQALRTAQTLSQSGKLDSVWGVYFPDGTVFAGDSYAERDSNHDLHFPLPSNVETSGLEETSFSRLDGAPSTTGIVYITSTITDHEGPLKVKDCPDHAVVSSSCWTNCVAESLGKTKSLPVSARVKTCVTATKTRVAKYSG